MPPRRFGRGWRDRAHAVVCRGRAWPSALSLRFREDAVEYPAVGEEALLRRLPAAKILVDGHQLQLGKLRGIFRRRRGLVGAVMIPTADVLRLGRVEIFEIRSEERRVGKESVSTCRSRWSPAQSKKNK